MGLSSTCIATLKGTSHLVIENAESVTSKMYDILFTEHPEIMKLFVDSDDEQHIKFAMALSAVALNVEHLERLEESLDRISKSHLLIGVRPEHYPFVGEALLKAMKTVLGRSATDDMLNAWGEVYDFLAGVLIAREKLLYAAR